MPRVHSQVANKDYPQSGIKKGDTYYKWAFRYGGAHKSLRYPRPSQLTQSKMSAAYAAGETLEDVVDDTTSDRAAIIAAADEAIEGLEGVRDEYQDSLDNMPNQDNPIGEGIQETIESLDEWIANIESAKGEIESADDEDFDDERSEMSTAAECPG